MNLDLHQAAENVHDESTFIKFISLLATDREDEVKKEQMSPSSPYGLGANGWENGSIESYLSAAVAWAESSQNGTPFYTPSQNPWRRAADILLMGKHYE